CAGLAAARHAPAGEVCEAGGNRGGAGALRLPARPAGGRGLPAVNQRLAYRDRRFGELHAGRHPRGDAGIGEPAMRLNGVIVATLCAALLAPAPALAQLRPQPIPAPQPLPPPPAQPVYAPAAVPPDVLYGDEAAYGETPGRSSR